MATDRQLARDVALRSITLMADGDRAAFDDVIAHDAVNHEADVEPPACRVGGPAGFHATALWLRAAYADLAHHVEHVVTEGDVVVVDTTMRGRHVGPFVLHDADGAVDVAWAPTGKTFAVRQTHWFRVADAKVAEHWAVRDDLGQGFQLGWVPPTPLYLLRCARAKRRAVRAVAALVLMGSALAGCGGTDDDSGAVDTPAVVSEAASAVPSDLTDAASADADLDGEADAGSELSAEAFCGFLAEETPKVVDLQPAEYAAAEFGSALVNFYAEQGLITDIDGAEMDSLAAEGCPEAAAAVLPALGATSFEDNASR